MVTVGIDSKRAHGCKVLFLALCVVTRFRLQFLDYNTKNKNNKKRHVITLTTRGLGGEGGGGSGS